jgi:tetratricopeptide (TPR) repeat protein
MTRPAANTAGMAGMAAMVGMTAMALLGAVWAPGARAAGETAPAACAVSKPGVAELEFQGALEKDPDAVDTRIRLANALSDRGCYVDAVKLLEAGVEHDPDSRLLKERLRSARSTQSEQGYFEGLGHAQEAASAQRNVLRCRELGDAAACDQALAATPGDHDLLVARGDALMRTGHPSEALNSYDKAATVQPADEALKSKVGSAEAARQQLVNRCLGETGDAALAACDQAMRHGAREEFALYQRKGVLLQSIDQPSRALESYIAASMLQPGDRSVALAIVALTDSTGRQDALALTARGSALLTLGRANDAVETLHRAETLSNAPEVRQRLAAAERAAQESPQAVSAAPTRVASASRAPVDKTPAATPAGRRSRGETAVASAATYSNSEPAGESH